MKVRAAKGFSLEEQNVEGIAKKLAPTIGISTNVQRLKTYKAKLVVFPRRACKVKTGDSSPEELATATQVRPTIELVKVTEDMKSFNVYDKLRLERTSRCLVHEGHVFGPMRWCNVANPLT
ncbi:hypothetical protein ACS0TY_015474 [Phlomoides rotata]